MKEIVQHQKQHRKAHEKSAVLVRYLCRKATRKLQHVRSALPLQMRIKQLEEQVVLLTSYSADTIYRLRYNTMTYEYISPAVIRLLGYTPEEMKHLHFRSLILETRLVHAGMRAVQSYEELEQRRASGHVQKWQADYLMRTKDGRKIWVSDVSYPWLDAKGRVIGSIGSLRDITDRVQAEVLAQEELLRLAHTDPLTGLANRREFFNRVETELKRIQRSKNDMSILLIDVDHFKKINDTYGHDIGDRILIDIGQVIRSCLRETDLAARIGGEEFGIFLPDTPSKGAYWVAERICKAVAKHQFAVGGKEIHCTVSIGVASSSLTDPTDAARLYKDADTRLYIAKHTGRNQVSMDEIFFH